MFIQTEWKENKNSTYRNRLLSVQANGNMNMDQWKKCRIIVNKLHFN